MPTSPYSSRTPSGANLCRPCPRCLSLGELICASIVLCLEGLVSLVLSLPNDSHSLSTGFPEPWENGFGGVILFMTACSTVSHSLPVIWMWISVSVPLYCRKKILWWWSNKVLIYEFNRMSLWVILLPGSFCTTVVSGFTNTTRLLCYLVSGFGHPSSAGYRLHFMEWVLS